MFLIVLFLIFGNSVHDCSEVIGNYTDFNDKSCGIYRIPQELCFKWHIKLSVGLIDTRNSLPGESPWSVLLRFKKCFDERCLGWIKTLCGGVLITHQWILTAAHCIENGFDPRPMNTKRFYVHFNPTIPKYYWNDTEYWSDEKYWHPLYKRLNSSDINDVNDIALLKLNKPVKIIPGIVNPICLPPERDFMLIEEERAVFSGFDTKSYDSDDNRMIDRLMISYWKVSSYTTLDDNDDNEPYLFNNTPPYPMANGSGFVWPGIVFATNQNREKACSGDSGSPMWQIYHGRAVLIGIASLAVLVKPDFCMPEEYLAYFPNGTRINTTEVPLYLTWVAMKIGWIKNVTKLN